MIDFFRSKTRRIVAGLGILSVLGLAGVGVYHRVTGSCCSAGSACCYPGSPCCKGHASVASR